MSSLLLAAAGRACLAATRPTSTSCTATAAALLRLQPLSESLSLAARALSAAPPSPVAASHAGHDHSRLWNAERALSAGLLLAVPASLMLNGALGSDYLLAVSLTLHAHWGLEAIVVDYVRPSLFGRVVPKVALAALYLLSIATCAGLFLFNWNDVGLAQAVKRLVAI